MVVDRRIGEELTQEAFFKAWKALNTLRDPAKFLSWLYRIAYHEAINHLRKTGEKGSYNQTLEDLEEVSIPGPEEQVETREQLE